MINNTSIQFSIIIPVFNNEQTIERAIQSCLSQTLQSFELIIINDGSIDNSKAIINAYSNYKNITILHNISNMGVSYSRNRGIAMAKGENRNKGEEKYFTIENKKIIQIEIEKASKLASYLQN